MDASFEIQVLTGTVKLLQARVAELEALLRRVSEREIRHTEGTDEFCMLVTHPYRDGVRCTCGALELEAAIEQALAAGEAT